LKSRVDFDNNGCQKERPLTVVFALADFAQKYAQVVVVEWKGTRDECIKNDT
jgi:hypothetical protein